MRRAVIAGFCLIAGVSAQKRFDNALDVTFRHGVLRVHTESTLAGSARMLKGVVAIGEGDVSHRMVRGGDGAVLFAYDLSMLPGKAGSYAVRATPADPERFVEPYLEFAPGDRMMLKAEGAPEFDGPQTVQPDGNIRVPMLGEIRAAGYSPGKLAAKIQNLLRGRVSDPRVSIAVIAARRDYPTIATVREFPHVGPGETVRLEVLADPSTGERLFDVIQPIAPSLQSRRQPAPDEEISLEEIRLSINGTPVTEFRNSWMIGSAVKIALPRIGTVFLTRTPTAGYAFQKLGNVDGKRLAFPVGEDRVEILAKSNILKRSATGDVWLYRDPEGRADAVAVEVGFPEDLLPKR